MTAYSADSLVQEGLDEGAIAALTKPLDIKKLLALLNRVGNKGGKKNHAPDNL